MPITDGLVRPRRAGPPRAGWHRLTRRDPAKRFPAPVAEFGWRRPVPRKRGGTPPAPGLRRPLRSGPRLGPGGHGPRAKALSRTTIALGSPAGPSSCAPATSWCCRVPLVPERRWLAKGKSLAAMDVDGPVTSPDVCAGAGEPGRGGPGAAGVIHVDVLPAAWTTAAPTLLGELDSAGPSTPISMTARRRGGVGRGAWPSDCPNGTSMFRLERVSHFRHQGLPPWGVGAHDAGPGAGPPPTPGW